MTILGRDGSSGIVGPLLGTSSLFGLRCLLYGTVDVGGIFIVVCLCSGRVLLLPLVEKVRPPSHHPGEGGTGSTANKTVDNLGAFLALGVGQALRAIASCVALDSKGIMRGKSGLHPVARDVCNFSVLRTVDPRKGMLEDIASWPVRLAVRQVNVQWEQHMRLPRRVDPIRSHNPRSVVGDLERGERSDELQMRSWRLFNVAFVLPIQGVAVTPSIARTVHVDPVSVFSVKD